MIYYLAPKQNQPVESIQTTEDHLSPTLQFYTLSAFPGQLTNPDLHFKSLHTNVYRCLHNTRGPSCRLLEVDTKWSRPRWRKSFILDTRTLPDKRWRARVLSNFVFGHFNVCGFFLCICFFKGHSGSAIHNYDSLSKLQVKIEHEGYSWSGHTS